MESNVLHIDTVSFKKEIIDSKKPVLVDFWAEWCGPCRMLTPTIDKIAEAYKDKIKVVKINTDDSPEIASEYHINAIPSVFIFMNGTPVEQMVGVQPYEAYAKAIDKNLKS